MNMLPVDENNEPISIVAEDAEALQKIQVLVDGLSRHRNEMGRLTQLLGNLRDEANKIEVDLAEQRRALANKYELEKKGSGQWALDFENKQFVKVGASAPVIP